MNKNYDILFQKEIESIQKNPLFERTKPSLFLHVCCAPCSSSVLERLQDYFNITIYYYNPNIHPKEEYTRRLNELENFLNLRTLTQNLLVEGAYNPSDYFSAVKTETRHELKVEKERGERCGFCYEFRLRHAAQEAKKRNMDYFTTALSISPHKDAGKINAIGEALEKEFNIQFLYADFKKRNGYIRSLELSKEFSLYRQDYCGCIYSKINSTNQN